MCPTCFGWGVILVEWFHDPERPVIGVLTRQPCHDCNGTGDAKESMND